MWGVGDGKGVGADLSIMTEPGIGPSIDQEKTLCGIADPDHCVGGGGGGGGLTMGSSKLACRGLLSFVSNVSHRKSWHRR